MRPEGDELEAIRPGLEGARNLRREPDRVKDNDLDDLVVELDPPAAAEDHVDLFGVRVAMSEG